MGQLERYGLYVLVLVIFLILGVAIWGGEPQAAFADTRRRISAAPETDLSARVGDQTPRARATTPSGGFDELFPDLESSLPSGADEMDLDSLSSVDLASSEPPEPEVPANSVSTPPAYRTYKIREYETLSDIAKRELGRATAWQTIVDLNPGLDPKRLKIGREIRLPGTGTVAIGSGQRRYHTVKSGEYLGSISQKYYNTARYADLIGDANNITDPRKIRAGKVLLIPTNPEK